MGVGRGGVLKREDRALLERAPCHHVWRCCEGLTEKVKAGGTEAGITGAGVAGRRERAGLRKTRESGSSFALNLDERVILWTSLRTRRQLGVSRPATRRVSEPAPRAGAGLFGREAPGRVGRHFGARWLVLKRAVPRCLKNRHPTHILQTRRSNRAASKPEPEFESKPEPDSNSGSGLCSRVVRVMMLVTPVRIQQALPPEGILLSVHKCRPGTVGVA